MLTKETHIVKMPDPFNKSQNEIIKVQAGRTILEISNDIVLMKNWKVNQVGTRVLINNQIVPYDEWQHRKLEPGEFLLFAPMVADGGGDSKSILNVVLMIALVWSTVGISAGFSIGGGVELTAFGAAALQIGIIVGGGMLISAMTPRPKKPTSGFIDSEQSQSFGWDPVTLQRQGIAEPRCYGLNKLTANIASGFTEKESDTFFMDTIIESFYYNLQGDRVFRRGGGYVRGKKEKRQVKSSFDPRKVKVNAMFHLGIGPIRQPSVSGSVELNGQNIVNLSDVHVEQRYGDNRQSVLSFFTNTKLELVFGRLCSNGTPVTVVTKNKNFNDLEIDVEFPQGLYDGAGANLANNTVNITLDIRKETGEVWTTIVNGVNITAAVGDRTIETYVASTQGFTVEYGFNYEVRLTKNTAERDSIRYGDKLYLGRVREIIQHQLTFPRRASVGVQALATDQLSGSLQFSTWARGLMMIDYTDSSNPVIYTTNPALVIADIFTQPVYSGAHSPWQDLELMCYFEGADDDIETEDSSPQGNVITLVSGANIEDTQKKFGTTSLYFNNDGTEYATITNNKKSFGIWNNLIEDWTFDVFVRLQAHDATEVIVGQYVDANNYWYLEHIDGAGFKLYVYIDGSAIVDISGVGEVTGINWIHLAICKDGANIGLYKNETQIGFATMTSTDGYVFEESDLYLAQSGNSSSWYYGYLDHLRFAKNNLFNAVPNSTPDDTITEPAVAYTDPGNSYTPVRYDGRNPSKLWLSDIDAVYDWCAVAQINSENFYIISISQAIQAVVVTNLPHNRLVGDTILFRNVTQQGMVELVDGTTATVLSVTDKYTLTVDLDTSGYTAYEYKDKILHNFEDIVGNVHRAFDGTVNNHNAGDAEFEGSSLLDTAQYKFGSSSLKIVEATSDNVQFPKSSDFQMFSNLTDDWTVSLFWRAATGADDTEAIFSVTQDAGPGVNEYFLEYDWASGDFTFANRINGAAQVLLDVNYSITKEQWYHILIVKKGDKFGLYVNGIIIDYYDMDAPEIYDYNDAWLVLGADANIPSYYMDGHIDDFYITNKNYFNANPDVGLTDTITPPTSAIVSLVPTIEEYQPRFSFNGIFDTEMTVWQAILQVCELCRCVPYFEGDKLRLAIDKSSALQYVYGMGNIVKDSFEETWIRQEERASSLEVHFRNKDDDFARSPFTIVNDNISSLSYASRLDLFGIIFSDEANRISAFKLNQNRYIKRLTKWTSPIEAMPSVIGDRVEVHHDATNYDMVGSGDEASVGSSRLLAADEPVNLLLNFEGTDGDTTTTDASKFGHAVVFGGSAEISDVEKKFGNTSLLCDGVDSEIKITGGAAFDSWSDLTSEWTWDFFIKMNSHAATDYLWSLFQDGSHYAFLRNVHGTALEFRMANGTTKITLNAAEIDDNDWHHIAVIKINNEIALYLDGVCGGGADYELLAAGDIIDLSADDLFIGQIGNDSGWTNGYFDAFRIHDKNIFDATLTSGSSTNITVPTAPSVNYSVLTIANEIVFDDADWDGGSTAYRVLLKPNDDSAPESKVITDVQPSAVEGGLYDITVAGTFSVAPQAGDIYACGIESIEGVDRRIIGVKSKNNFEIDLLGVEYVEALYDDD